MARVRVMYWKEIPVQVQAEDEDNRVTRQLDERFQKAVDAVAMIDGSQGMCSRAQSIFGQIFSGYRV